MNEETQVRQIEENIAGLERRIASLRVHKSADTTAKILELEHIISDLRGHLAWHRRRMGKEGRDEQICGKAFSAKSQKREKPE